ncbi:MAG: purine-nucleoside phosphorylase [Deltaproteobacteria bacterium]|nr:purine-nucleoside phosphorylase [Deltaproteobacteria bacterium]
MLDKIQETADTIASKLSVPPEFGMITGTGLGGLTEQMEKTVYMPYEDIPNFLSSTTEGHHGRLAIGAIRDRSVMAMEGRLHLYEGYSPADVTFPVRVMAMLGVKTLLISSAAGGLNPLFQKGDLMVVTDHINFQGINPLRGPNLDHFGPRFPDMTGVYDKTLITLTRDTALQLRIPIREGVYAGVLGPSLETPAETRFLRMAGADAVGMSTVAEATVGVHCSLRILAIVVITNKNLPDCMEPTTLDEVVAVAGQSGEVLATLWGELIAAMG